jgi:methylmalonyl-CoA/ethylmalonyl-CoA epimerase
MELVQVAQHAEDLDRAERFYSLLLRAAPTARFDPPGLLFFAVGRTRLLLDREAPSSLLYLEVAGLRERIEELRAMGVSVKAEPHVIFEHEDGRLGRAGTAEWQAFIEDSEGNLVGLVEQVPHSGP